MKCTGPMITSALRVLDKTLCPGHAMLFWQQSCIWNLSGPAFAMAQIPEICEWNLQRCILPRFCVRSTSATRFLQDLVRAALVRGTCEASRGCKAFQSSYVYVSDSVLFNI